MNVDGVSVSETHFLHYSPTASDHMTDRQSFISVGGELCKEES